MKICRLWPAFVLALFCLPLFVGLGNEDVRGDEAIYSWGVDRILETGDWLIPKSSPWLDAPFFEKPPLKFWIVAGGIRAGLPHNEFGLRFWDALFGGAALLYVFAIGRRLGGSLCGAVAAFVLFVHQPLLFEHGFRTNNMEAGLVLAYCGGVFHYLCWASGGRPALLRGRASSVGGVSESDATRFRLETDVRRRWLHAMAVAGYFALGFLLKFVAALFLPVVLGLASLIARPYRTRLIRDWRAWLSAHLLALVLIAPWFVYCTVRFGSYFWHIIWGSHVYTRLTSYLDPSHVHPWNYYVLTVYDELRRSGTLWLVVAGAVILLVDTIRRRWADGLVIILWFAAPIALISFGTSKLYHYLYPFLPPVGLAAGYGMSFLWTAVRPALERPMHAVGRFINQSNARWSRVLRMPAMRRLFLGLAALSLIVMVWTLVDGSMMIRFGGTTLFRNRQLLRPAVAAALLAILGGWPEGVARVGVLILILAILPVPVYRQTLKRLTEGTHVLRPARDCMTRVGSRPDLKAAGPRGMYVDGNGDEYWNPFNHEYAYYFRSVGPWRRPKNTPGPLLYRYLFDPSEQRPVLIANSRYDAFLQAVATGNETLSTPTFVFVERDVVLVLPGPYSVCRAEILASQGLR